LSRRLHHILWAILMAVPFAVPPSAFARQGEDSLAVRLRAHAFGGDVGAVDAHVAAHRLSIRPVVDAWVGEGLRSELRGDTASSARTLAAARLVADRFREIHGERSLSFGLGYVDRWTRGEKATKLIADSLSDAALSARTRAESREAALADYGRALDLYRSIGDGRGVANVLGGMGYVYFFLDRARYLEFNLEAIRAREAVDDQQLLGNAHADVGTAYWRFEGDLDRARDHYETSRAIRARIGDTVGLGRLLSNLGKVYEAQGEFGRAVDAYRESGRLLEAAGDHGRAADAMQLAALSLSDYFGSHSEAILELDQALGLRELAGDAGGLIGTLNNQGILYRRLGDLDGAVAAYQRVIGLAREQGDDLGVARATNNLGVVFLWAERPERAVTWFGRALEQFEAIGDASGVRDAVVNLASSHFESRQYAEALPHAERALALSREAGDRVSEGSSMVLLGNILGYLGQVEAARSSFDDALVRSRELGIPDLEFSTLLSLGEYHERFGDPDSALVFYDRAFETLEGLRSLLATADDKAGFLAQQRYAYESVIHFLSKRNESGDDPRHAAAAFAYAERGKARAFLDLLAESLTDVSAGVAPELKERREALLSDIADVRRGIPGAAATDPDVASALRDSLQALEAEYGRLERRLRAENPRYSELQYPEPGSLADIRASLPGDAVLLEYALGDSSSALWAITGESARMYRLPPRDRVAERVELLRFALADPSRGSAAEYQDVARALFDELVAPAAEFLASHPTLIVVPDGVLSYVPFEALVVRPTDAPEYGSLAYLARTHAVSYAPSASVLRTIRSGASEPVDTAPSGLVAFGDPVFAGELAAMRGGPSDPGSDLARLPYTGDEVRAIGSLFPEGQARLYLRDDATEEAVLSASALSGFRYVHFATHGIVNEDRPDFSGLALSASSDGRGDGFLQVAEIFNLRLDADLVVLSACETGLGRMVRGEGLLGLTRAFLYAGASSLVVSLWSVADRSTSELMQRFYASLVKEGESKTAALRSAKLSMLDDPILAHPFNWAPFTLIGDWQ
jgi:CHAT domain-containing protein/Flp pilus assembly protein TadD